MASVTRAAQLPRGTSANDAFRKDVATWSANAVDNAPSLATKRAYDAALTAYRAVCVKMGCYHPVHGDFYPPMPFLLLAFVYHLVGALGLAVTTTKARISAVRGHALMLGLPDCFDADGRMPRVIAVALLGAERERALTALKPLQRVPASAAVMRVLLDRANAVLGPFEAARFRAMITMAYFAALRLGDILAQTVIAFDPLLHLCTTGVTMTKQTLPTREANVINLTIQSSKTDRKRKGRVVMVVDQPGGMSLFDALTVWLHQRETHEQLDWSPAMFVTARGQPMTTRSFRLELAKVTSSIEALPQGVLPHSFRKGAATVLKAHDYSDSVVAAAGRWASNCFLDYISPIVEKQDQMFASLATSAY